MKLLPSIFGERSADSPLDGLPVVFPAGTTSREISVTRAEMPNGASRSMSMQQFALGFGELALGAGVVGRTEAWRNPHVRRCVEATAQTIAGLPFVIYDGETPKKKHWWLDFVEHPNEYLQMSEHDLKEQTVAIRELFGESFWFMDREDTPSFRGTKAPVSAIWIYHPHAVTEAIDTRTRQQIGWVFQWETERFFVDRDDVVQFRRYDPMRHNPRRPSRGSSPLEAALLAVSTDTAASRYNLEFFSRGFAPGVILLTKDNVHIEHGTQQMLAAKLRAEHGGKNDGVAVLDGSEVSVVQLGKSQRDAEFSNAKKIAMSEILEVFGAPPCVAGNQDQKYDNAEMQLLLWWDGPLASIISNLRAAINNGPLKGEPAITCDLDTSRVAVLRKRNLEAVDKYISLISNARHTPKEASRIAGVDVDPKMPGYDVALVSFSQIPLEFAMEGASVSISKDDSPETTQVVPPPSSVEPEPVVATPSAEPQRTIRLIAPAHIANRADEAGDEELLRVLMEIIAKDTKRLRDKARTYQLRAIESGAKQMGETLETQVVLISVDNPRVVAFLNERGNLIESVPAGVADRIFRKTTSLIEQGTSPEDIGTLLRKDFNILSDVKSRQIARNEVGSALNGGRHLQMEEDGVDMREWLSSRDGRVRESHDAIDGETVGLDEVFSNGCRFPQDPEGPPDETILCRCIEMPVFGGSRSARMAAHIRAVAALHIRAAADNGEQIDERTGYWRAVVQAKDVRMTERDMAAAMKSFIHGWRAPVLKTLAEMGIAK